MKKAAFQKAFGPREYVRGASKIIGKSFAVEYPDVVAEEGLQSLEKRSTVRPGRLAKILGYGLASAARWVRVKIMGLIMKGMTRHLPG